MGHDRPAGNAVPIAILLGTISNDPGDRLHHLVRAARKNDAAALSEVIDRVRLAAPDVWPDIRSAVVVGVPGHRPGPANRLVLAVADDLAATRGWKHARDALRRIRPAPEAKDGGPRDVGAEAATLEWAPGSGGTTIILVDDVARTGSTLRACATAIHATGDRRPIVAVAVAERPVRDPSARSTPGNVHLEPLVHVD